MDFEELGICLPEAIADIVPVEASGIPAGEPRRIPYPDVRIAPNPSTPLASTESIRAMFKGNAAFNATGEIIPDASWDEQSGAEAYFAQLPPELAQRVLDRATIARFEEKGVWARSREIYEAAVAPLPFCVGDVDVFVRITYPTSHPALFRVQFTADLQEVSLDPVLLHIAHATAYKVMYALEDAAIDRPTGCIPVSLNRATSAGPYGIWGHDISDLVYNGANEVYLVGRAIICEFDCDS